MKFPVTDKPTRVGTSVFMLLGLTAELVFFIFMFANGMSLMEWWTQIVSLGVFPIIIAIVFLGGLPFYTAAVIYFALLYVIVDENSVRLCVFKLTVRKFVWTDIKRIEVFEEIQPKYTRPLINVMLENKLSKLCLNNRNAPNIHRKYMTFLYSPEALELIQKYCQCDIFGLEIAEKYSK